MKTEINNDEVENIVLGAILLEPECLDLIEEEFDPELFYNQKNNMIARAITELISSKQKVDIITVSSKVKNSITPFEVSSKTNRIASSENIVTHLLILKELFLKRKLLQLSLETIRDLETLDIFDIINKNEVFLQNAISNCIRTNFDTISSLKSGILLELSKKIENKTQIGIQTGLTGLDATIGGFVKSNLIIVAARPAMGKTALMLNFARRCSFVQNKGVGIFSLEMSNEQLINRIITAECEISSDKINLGTNLNGADLINIEEKLSNLNDKIFFEDVAALNILELRQKIRKLVKERGCELIIIDYLQLLTTSEYKNDKVRQIGDISHKLKAYAKEFNVPIIALSQLNRKVEDRTDKKPILSDLRESGDIEQDADQIIFLYRPEYYGSESIETPQGAIDAKGKAVIEIAKNRHGRLLTDIVGFSGEYMKFYNL